MATNLFCFNPKLSFELPICFYLVLFAKPRTKHKDQQWRQAVDTDNELDILEEWAKHWKAKSRDVGRWRQISAIQRYAVVKDVRDKREGLLARIGDRIWNLYFLLTDDFSFDEFSGGIAAHPMTAIGAPEPPKLQRHWDFDTKRWIEHDHLSPNDYGFRCRRNFSVLGGYTKNGDGKPDKNGQQMTHAWMELTSGRWRSEDGGEHNLQLIANMLCEICGFSLPYPQVFQDEDVSLLDLPLNEKIGAWGFIWPLGRKNIARWGFIISSRRFAGRWQQRYSSGLKNRLF